MEINKILTADILDIIFDGKNKQYGAYDLRKTYNSRLKNAVIITISLVLLALLGTILSDYISKNSKVEIEVLDTQMAEVKKNDAPHHHHHLLLQRHHHHPKLIR